MIIQITVFLAFYALHVLGFCHINTATQTQKQMLMSRSDMINKNVQDIINKYSARTGTRPELIKSCVTQKQQKQTYMQKKQQVLHKRGIKRI